MNRGYKKRSGQEKIVQRVETDVRQRDEGDEPVGDVESDEPGDQKRAKNQAEACKNYRGQVNVPGAGDGQVTACHQTQEGYLEEALDRKLRVNARARPLILLAGGKRDIRTVDLPSGEGGIRQAGLGLQQCDALPIQHRSFFRYKGSWREWRSERNFWQVN